MEGFIALHRKLISNPIFQKPGLLQLFIYCLLRANFKDTEIIFNDELVKLKRGSFITGIFELCKAIKQKQTTTYDRLKLLQKLGYIHIDAKNKFSIISVVNYSKYQKSENEKSPEPLINKGDNKGIVIKSENQPKTNRKPADTDNNDYNDNKNRVNLFLDMIPEHLNNIPGFIGSWTDFVQHRKELKSPLTKTAAKTLLNKIDRLQNEGHDPLPLIEKSIMRGWKGIFADTNQFQPDTKKEQMIFNFH